MPPGAEVRQDDFGVTVRGEAVSRFTLVNEQGTRACLLDYGARLTELWLPGRDGRLADVVLGFDSLRAYEEDEAYVGCTVGRVANRIAGASFRLDGKAYPLAANHGPNHLHGGHCGFDKRVWASSIITDADGASVGFTLTSPDGDEGYPGTLSLRVRYRLGPDNSLEIAYQAETDCPTPVNLTNHTYWNLAGKDDILGHELLVRSESYTEVDDDLIPTGRLLPVEGTPFDFRRPKPIGRDLAEVGVGYDHNFVLAMSSRPTPQPAAELHDPGSGRTMTILTTQPGIQCYTGNYLEGPVGKRGSRYPRHGAVCLETQHFPDALHHPEFPSVVLRPGQTYRQATVHRFSVR